MEWPMAIVVGSMPPPWRTDAATVQAVSAA
jgi:hypothetical protein